MKKLEIKPVLCGAAILVVVSANSLLGQTGMKVNRDMLLWKKGFAYRTQVNADISLTNTKIKVEMSDRKAYGDQSRSFHYQGAMVYNTELENASTINGSARRYYQQCDMLKSETELVKMTVPASAWEVWKMRFGDLVGKGLPAEWSEHVVVEKGEVEVFGDSYIVVRQKTDSPNLLGGGALELAFQSMGVLSGKWFLLEWTRMSSIRKASVQVSPGELRGGALMKTGGSVNNTVKDVIGRESKLLYEALLGFDGDRQPGEMWIVDGETLDAMVHPTVKGSFRGSALVKAEVIKNKSPVRTVSEMNGFMLKFVSRGMVDGKSHGTDLRFVVETVNGDNHETKLTPEDGGFSGEIWLDTDNQTVRYGELKVVDARYSGFLPKIGDLNAKINLDADFNFRLLYIQSISAAED